ncbi:MAG: SPOR domain-containing protein [Rickettsiales bacterium]
MKKNLQIPSLLVTVSSIAVSIFITNAYASDNFYIEIGNPASVEETNEQWHDLSRRYKSSIGKLTFYPKTKINRQGEASTVIQAGPISEKSIAQKTCNRLFAERIPCFVIEGIEEKPPTMSVRISRLANNPSEITAIFPWQSGYVEPQISPTEDSQFSEDVDVAVAEAIPVPLTSNTIDIATPDAHNPFPETQKTLQSNNLLSREFASKETGWLVVDTFSNDGSANNFWNQINNNFPKETSGLRARIQRPPASNDGDDGIKINIYPFPNGATAANFCDKVINRSDTSLECHYEISNSPTTTKANTAWIKSNHADSYDERRQLFQRRLPAQQITQRDIFDQSEKSYWVQVAIGDSRTEANNRWEDIKKANLNTVKGLTSKLTASSSAYAKYTVSLGTLASEREATELCGKLQLRGVDCLVVSTKE